MVMCVCVSSRAYPGEYFLCVLLGYFPHKLKHEKQVTGLISERGSIPPVCVCVRTAET